MSGPRLIISPTIQGSLNPIVDKLVSKHGCVGGAIQTDPVEVIPMGNRTIQRQALQEALNKRLKKYRGGYRRRGAPPPTKILPS